LVGCSRRSWQSGSVDAPPIAAKVFATYDLH
jgi:hypothetical protein